VDIHGSTTPILVKRKTNTLHQNEQRDEDQYSMYSSGYSDSDDESTMEEKIGHGGTINEGDFQNGETAPTGERRSQTRIVARPPEIVTERILQDMGMCTMFQVEPVEGTPPAEAFRAE
jgi:hypothetical protein